MCTVSVVPARDGFRMACNRDEQRSRPIALPPRVRRLGNVCAIWPEDPPSAGTWIGANNAGLVMVLLNRGGTAPAARAGCRISRGTIIPRLLRTTDIAAAVNAATDLLESTRSTRFERFTLVLLQRRLIAVVNHDGSCGSHERGPLAEPVLFTSSSLGDEVAAPPREALFAALVRTSPWPLTAQTRFHHHQWPAHPEISVRMSRPDAATVSYTTVDVTGASVAMRYAGISQDFER